MLWRKQNAQTREQSACSTPDRLFEESRRHGRMHRLRQKDPYSPLLPSSGYSYSSNSSDRRSSSASDTTPIHSDRELHKVELIENAGGSAGASTGAVSGGLVFSRKACVRTDGGVERVMIWVPGTRNKHSLRYAGHNNLGIAKLICGRYAKWKGSWWSSFSKPIPLAGWGVGVRVEQ